MSITLQDFSYDILNSGSVLLPDVGAHIFAAMSFEQTIDDVIYEPTNAFETFTSATGEWTLNLPATAVMDLTMPDGVIWHGTVPASGGPFSLLQLVRDHGWTAVTPPNAVPAILSGQSTLSVSNPDLTEVEEDITTLESQMAAAQSDITALQAADTFGSPVAVGNSNLPGSSSNVIRADHVHALGGTVSGDLTGTLPTPAIASGAVTAAKMASGAAATNVGSLSGDLTGSLPGPTIAAGAVSAAKMASGAAASNVGALSGDLTGSLPNPSLASGVAASNVGSLSGDLTGTLPSPAVASAAITAAKLASGAAASNVGSLSGDLTGTLPSPSVASASITAAKMASGAAATNVGSLSGDLTGTLPSPTVANNAITNAKLANSAVDSLKLTLTVYSDITRPAATTFPAGSVIFNSDDKAPNFSDGTDWYNSQGART